MNPLPGEGGRRAGCSVREWQSPSDAPCRVGLPARGRSDRVGAANQGVSRRSSPDQRSRPLVRSAGVMVTLNGWDTVRGCVDVAAQT